MIIPVAIPAHVDNDSIWLHFTSPKTGKQSSINMQSIIDKTGGIVFEAMQEWADAQRELHTLHNPKPASPDVPR